jgi:deoxyribose-phosphate aldolase
MDIARFIDHTLLKAEAKPKDIDKLCAEAKHYDFAAVCVNPLFVEQAVSKLKGTGVRVATVIGFPLGATNRTIKAREAREAIDQGAAEIDMVMPVGMFLAGDVKYVARDIREVVLAAGALPVKVIIETCYLSPNQIVDASKIARDEGATFVKTSTGFGTRGATVEDVKIIKETVGNSCQIKASGGIRTREIAMAMIEAGASRIGTSSGVEIVGGKGK